jgi:hypothetical protein
VGATGAVGATGGTAGLTACEPELDDRLCRIDTDCRLSGVAPCCGTARIYGVNNVTACAQGPSACDADCIGAQWITDTKEATFDLSVVQLRCEVGEPGAGLCVSYVNLGPPPPPTYCDGEFCLSTEVCVHYATPGGPQPPCVPLFDGGSCPPDSKEDICPDTGTWGCVPVQFAPPPQCVPVSCADPVDCGCLPDGICGGLASQCSGVMLRDVFCVDLSP